METITIYVAEDGTKFNDERECIDYEDKMLIQKVYDSGIRFYDYEFKRIGKVNFNKSKYIVYIYIPNKKACDLLISASDKYLLDINITYTNNGYYYYNPVTEDYESLEENIKHLLDIKKSLKEA